MGRHVPLQRKYTKGLVALYEIRSIIFRSHISKIMEKAILECVKSKCPLHIASKVYHTGFKQAKPIAIHSSRLLNEVHGPRKRRFNLFVDLKMFKIRLI